MKEKNTIGLFIQVVLLILLIIFLIINLFIPELKVIIDYLLIGSMFILAYNNYSIYKRKYMTVIYFIIGILLLISIIFKVF